LVQVLKNIYEIIFYYEKSFIPLQYKLNKINIMKAPIRKFNKYDVNDIDFILHDFKVSKINIRISLIKTVFYNIILICFLPIMVFIFKVDIFYLLIPFIALLFIIKKGLNLLKEDRNIVAINNSFRDNLSAKTIIRQYYGDMYVEPYLNCENKEVYFKNLVMSNDILTENIDLVKYKMTKKEYISEFGLISYIKYKYIIFFLRNLFSVFLPKCIL